MSRRNDNLSKEKQKIADIYNFSLNEENFPKFINTFAQNFPTAEQEPFPDYNPLIEHEFAGKSIFLHSFLKALTTYFNKKVAELSFQDKKMLLKVYIASHKNRELKNKSIDDKRISVIMNPAFNKGDILPLQAINLQLVFGQIVHIIFSFSASSDESKDVSSIEIKAPINFDYFLGVRVFLDVLRFLAQDQKKIPPIYEQEYEKIKSAILKRKEIVNIQTKLINLTPQEKENFLKKIMPKFSSWRALNDQSLVIDLDFDFSEDQELYELNISISNLTLSTPIGIWVKRPPPPFWREKIICSPQKIQSYFNPSKDVLSELNRHSLTAYEEKPKNQISILAQQLIEKLKDIPEVTVLLKHNKMYILNEKVQRLLFFTSCSCEDSGIRLINYLETIGLTAIKASDFAGIEVVNPDENKLQEALKKVGGCDYASNAYPTC